MINTEEKTLKVSLLVAVVVDAQICLTDYLTDCYFHRTVCKQKYVLRNLTVSQYFRAVVKMGRKRGKTSIIVK